MQIIREGNNLKLMTKCKYKKIYENIHAEDCDVQTPKRYVVLSNVI